MTGQVFITRDTTTGLRKEVAANQTGGSGAENAIAAYDSTGRVPLAAMPVGIVPDSQALLAGEALTAGDYCYINSSDEIVRASAAPGGHEATGFVLASSALADPATIYFEGRNTAHTGLTPGARYFLSATVPGGVTTTPVVGTGKMHQQIGNAASATEMNTTLTADIISPLA